MWPLIHLALCDCGLSTAGQLCSRETCLAFTESAVSHVTPVAREAIDSELNLSSHYVNDKKVAVTHGGRTEVAKDMPTGAGSLIQFFVNLS